MTGEEEETRAGVDSTASGSVDEDEYETNDAIDAISLSADSMTISDDVRDYIYENSRRYHKYSEGRYHFPNDDAEQEREDMQHAMVMLRCDGKLHFAPLENPQTILDVGTGTGIWAIEMGDQYPDAEILGVDLSPIQPLWVPRNVQFLVDDVEAEWLQPPNSLDYIHSRQMAPTIRDWPFLIGEAYKALKPGGWFELQDLKITIKSEEETAHEENLPGEFCEKLVEALRRLGIHCLSSVDTYEKWLEEAGFVNIQSMVFKTPLGTWPTDPKEQNIGLFSRNMIYDGLHAFTIRPYTHGLGWTPEEVEVYLVNIRKAVLNSKAHLYIPYHVVFAQKPLEPTTSGSK